MSLLKFDPTGPFPLVTYDECSYQEAQEHSVEIDNWLGFQTADVEKKLLTSQDYNVQADKDIPVQCWRGLPVQALQTPYSEIRWILNLLNLKPQETIVDLGCGYGRMAFVVGRHYPDNKFVGYELVAERVAEGNRILRNFNYPNAKILTQDLTAPDFIPEKAEHYFLFDFGSAPAIDKTLDDLKRIARGRSINIVARGRYIRHRIYQAHPWLSSINEPQVHETFTIFTS
ncbi:class I SAM-dependent methyltransferase [Bdellovibrio svalbardensis]|uniref:Class I SAM-dependent methyltransferase n=1 Tax=Bdellovibrio svalbardensis TaxID=2972972 RepID=A0ABT6DL36_9BACT|nr:class I SAM-dependent methyltransferase [Bdellovibrio svalbardensis]MDG0817589.1 class I SAM-dependent methyltransferase [Bdellovibrio svalbardensis]